MLTGIKYLDRKTLNELDDVDLVNACRANKKAELLCNDQVFWMNRVFLRFGYVDEDILRNNKGNRSWSEYYIHDLRKINKNNAKNYLKTGSKNNRLDHVMISMKKGSYDYDYAIQVSSEIGNVKVVRYLAENGANIHRWSDQALRLASSNGHLEVVKYLVEQGADINTEDDQPLISASSNGHLEVVKYLVEKGANIHADDDNAVKMANKNNHLEVVRYLVKKNQYP